MTDELHALRISQYQALREGAALVDRAWRGVLRVTGSDRRSFLQGLLTNDIVTLGEGRGCYAAYLTAQGRMIADMRVLETGEAIVVDLDRSLAAATADRWSQLVFSEDVEVADISGDSVELGIYGPQSARVLAAATALPEADLERMTLHANRLADAAIVVRSDEIGVMGYDVIAPSALKEELTGRMIEAGGVAIVEEVAEASRIEAGRPRFLVDMDAETIPLEAGIEDRAISLTKGCYVGQEVIIRVLHRGHGRVARRLVRLELDGADGVPRRGDAIVSGERQIGAVTSAAVSLSSARPIALGYVHRDFAEPGKMVSIRRDTTLLPATVNLEPRT